MSKKLWDVIIVGGGPAGITAALRLAREDLDVLVVEAAVYPGAENWSGAVYFAENLADPAVLGEDELARAPFERRVVKRGFFSCNGLTMVGAEYHNPESFSHCYTVLRPVYDRYLAERARQLGVTLLTETTVDGLVRHADRVIGVHTDRGPLYGEIVFLAEGDASHLVSKEGFEGDAVYAKANGQPAFLQGVKEVIELDPALIEQRFGVGPGEAACYEILLRNGAVDGKPLRLNMAGLIYTNRSSVSIGLVLPLDNLAQFSGDYNTLMEWYKGLPPIRRFIEGGESTSFGAKIIRSGGLRELPRLVDNGLAIGGAATGIGIDFPYPNYTGPACAMGRIFAEAAIRLHENGEEPTGDKLEALYVKPLKATHYYKDVEHLQNWPAFIEYSEALMGRQIDLLNGSCYVMTRSDLGFARKWWETVRMVGETMKGKWSTTLGDLNRGSGALGINGFIAKHTLPALLLSIPNTLVALLPFAWGRPTGELRLSLWVENEDSGKLPIHKRWGYARFRAALSKAAHVLYANDDRPVREKLDRCVGIVMRRLSLWELVAGIVGALAFWLTRGLQKLSDIARYSRRKPTLDELKATFYGRWVTRWREHTDLSAGRVAVTKSHDAKLNEISYSGDAGSHIKVFFPPAGPGQLEDPAKSALWSVCPAEVYQIDLDRTMHASVAANFENCVKCETCWRIEPQHVDWSRFGKHRLVYEVYTEADGALREIISERDTHTGPEIEPSFWTATLSDEWSHDRAPAASEELREAISEARRAIDRAEAKCAELRDNVWRGPRVLEAGQVSWYRATTEYFAHLAQRAANASLATPIGNWLTQHDLTLAHVELVQITTDLERCAASIYEHAAARRFFAAEADSRQIRDHHLAGLRACLDRIADACGFPQIGPNPVATLRAQETETPARARARLALRERLAQVFDRQSLRRFEHGGALEEREVDVVRAACQAVLGSAASGEDFEAWSELERADILSELSRVDSSLGAIAAGHIAAVEALMRAGAPDSILKPLRSVERFTTVAMEAEVEPGDRGWSARTPFVTAALADSFVARGGGQIGLFSRKGKGVRLDRTPAMGLTGAEISEIVLESAKPAWENEWSETDDRELFGLRARDVAAIAFGAGSFIAERAIDHARNRIQFPDMFRDIDGRDAVGKFGAVREHVAHIEVGRLAVETLLSDTRWTGADGMEATLGKVAITDIFGPDMPSITYRAGQVAGGSAFSEEDIFSKIYRDSSIFPHYIRENALLNIEIGARISAATGQMPLEIMMSEVDQTLEEMAGRPIFDAEVMRLRTAEHQLGQACLNALELAGSGTAEQAIQDITGELAARLYVWARLLVRAYRRIEAALPAERYVEAAQLWADTLEERMVALEQELAAAAGRVELGGFAYQLADYPDHPIASDELGFDYRRDIVDGARGYKSGDFLLEPLDLDGKRYVPELIWADDALRSCYDEYLKLFREQFVEREYEPSYERYVEKLHYIPQDDIDWTRRHGFFRVVIPKEYGGLERPKADYYNLCMISKRLADVSHTLTIQANTSIGTTPMLLGLHQDVADAERDLQAAMSQEDAVLKIADGIKKILAMMERPDFEALKNAYIALDKEVRGGLGRSRILKKVVFGKFLSAWGKAGMAGLKGDLDGFGQGLEKALVALDGWQGRAAPELEEMPLRRMAHEFYLRLISARMISAFSLTEPSAGSDTARIRTEARLDSRRVHTDEDGIKFFYLDEETEEGRRNIADIRRFEFDYDNSTIFYRYDDDTDAAEVHIREYSYVEGEEKYRYFMIGDRRIDIHDMAIVRQRDGAELYEFYVLNGAKMWITNGHIAGVEAIYARTPAGVTGFMVDALTDGFFVGKDEEKTGQRGSCTNEITLTNVRIPRECMIGIEGRGQENALETLNVGRAGLCISSAAGIQQAIGDACDFLGRIPRGSEGWARYRLGLAIEEMFATESISFDLIGLSDDRAADSLRVECSVAKFFGTDGLHRNLHYLEPVYGIEGQLQRYRIEKDRRDARVMTIYEGTNEIQQFLLLKDLTDMIGPKLEKLEELGIGAEDSPYAHELRCLSEMVTGLHERLKLARKTYKSAIWQRAIIQPTFFRLSRMAVLVKVVDSVVYRAHWIARNLTADADEQRREWADRAARGFVTRAQREFSRLAHGFDRDFETLRTGGRPAELRLVETVFDEADAAVGSPVEDGILLERTPIERQLEIVVAVEHTPRLAPRPRLADGQVAEHLYTFSAGDRRALGLALALKRAAPERVSVTLICAAPRAAEDQLRIGLAAGADRAVLLDTRGARYTEPAMANAIADALHARGIRFDLLLSGASQDSLSSGRLALRLAANSAARWVPAVSDVWVRGDEAIHASQRFPDTLVRMSLPVVAAVAATESEPEWEFTTAGWASALRRPLSVVPFPTDAARSDEEFATAAVVAAAQEGEEAGSVEPERAAEVLLELGDLGDGAAAPTGTPYAGEVRDARPDDVKWDGVVFVAELDENALARNARAPLAAAQAIAARASLPLSALVLTGKLDDKRRKAVAGQLLAQAPFARVAFAEHDALASGAPQAYAEALVRLLGPAASSRPAYVLTSPWLAESLPILGHALRGGGVAAEELAGVSRVELGGVDDGLSFVRPVYDRKLRARRFRPATGGEIRILWCEPEVMAEAGTFAASTSEVVHIALDLDYDPETDALARAISEAKRTLGVVTLENAEFIIDVGAGLGSVDTLETVVEPLRRLLVDIGAPHVEIGATRKVTMDKSWLPDERQIGQTGVRVNPRVMIALGVSGAPQHIDWVGDRAVIFAFNMDAQAPLMTLNQRREQPKVYPVVGDLFKTLPKFVQALRRKAGK